MSRQFDQAQQLDLDEAEALVKRHRETVAPLLTAPPNAPTECEECGDEIPAKRREALPGTALCANCKAYFEQQHKRNFG